MSLRLLTDGARVDKNSEFVTNEGRCFNLRVDSTMYDWRHYQEFLISNRLYLKWASLYPTHGSIGFLSSTAAFLCCSTKLHMQYMPRGHLDPRRLSFAATEN